MLLQNNLAGAIVVEFLFYRIFQKKSILQLKLISQTKIEFDKLDFKRFPLIEYIWLKAFLLKK